MKRVVICSLILSSFLLIASKPAKKYYNELYRPQFHFTVEMNQLKKPGGLVYYKGEYHLFYQYVPDINQPDVNQWGHAVSNNLINWEHLPVVLPSGTNEGCNIFSGSAIVDENNLLGKEKGNEKTLVLFYSGNGCGQNIAYSTDRGRTWEHFEGNPVIPYIETGDAQDPKVVWDESSSVYVMLLSRQSTEDEKSKGVSFYTSENLVDWEFKSHIYGFSESPDMVRMQVTNRPEETKWALFDGDGSYLIGNFNGNEFSPETGKMKSDFGNNYFATQTWNNIPEENGRVIQIAWMNDSMFPDMPFNGQLTFPSELSLTRFNFGYKITRKPVDEIELLHGKHYNWADKNLIPGLNKNIVKNVKGDCLHIIGEFDLKTCSGFGFLIRNSKKKVGAELVYDVNRGILSLTGVSAPLLPIDNKITLDILIDRSSIEVYANGGQTVITNYFTPEEGAENLLLFNSGGEIVVENLDIYKIESAWDNDN